MPAMTTGPEIATVSRPGAGLERKGTPRGLLDLRNWLRWGASGVMLGLLFLWWPYHKWTFSEKVSVLVGWLRVLANDTSGEWVFCPLVPIMSAGLVWRLRGELRSLPVRGHSSGIALLFFAGFVFWIGHRAGVGYPGFVAMLLMLAGLVVWLCGWGWMRLLAFPWIFLAFMWPSFPLESHLAVPMRVLAASLTAEVLGVIGVASVSEGTALVSAPDLANGLSQGARFRLDVTAACSGLRSLYALLILAAFSGYVCLRRWGPRSVLFLSALPLAVAGNIVRLLLLTAGTIWLGEEFAVGRRTPDGEETSWFHQCAGLAVYAVALGGLFAISSVLERSRWNRPPAAVGSRHGGSLEDSFRVTACRAAVVLAVAAAVLGVCAYGGGRSEASEAGVVTALPTRVGSLRGLASPVTERERRHLQEDVTIHRMQYTGPAKPPMQVAVVLDGAAGRGLHNPEVCALAQAWRVRDERVIPLQIGDRKVNATMLRLFMDVSGTKGSEVVRRRAIHVFWYQGARGASAANFRDHGLRNYWDALSGKVKSRWALMSFSVYLPDNASEADHDLVEASALAELKSLIAEIGPRLIAAQAKDSAE
jgi:exosortase